MWQRPVVHWILIVVVFFAALAPTLTWVEFSGGMENFNVETALETVRHGNWLIPTLDGVPRTNKPPLTQWITSLGIISGNSTAFDARWPSLLMAAFSLVAVYELGRATLDWRLGLTSALVCGSTFLFLKFAWQASYDPQLAMWVILANAFFAHAIFRGRWWLGCGGCGVALGMALMTKGPVALLQSIVPMAAFCIAMRPSAQRARAARSVAIAIGVGVAIMLAISLPWPVYIIRHMPDSIAFWGKQIVLHREAMYDTRMRWHTYFVLIPWIFFPWCFFFIAGFIDLCRRAEPQCAARAGRVRLMLFLFVVPIAVMIFFPERRDRYLLPMAGPAAVIAAWGVLRFLPAWGRGVPMQRLLVILHGGGLALIVLGLPIAGAVFLKAADGSHWYTPGAAATAIVGGMMMLAAATWAYRRAPGGFVVGTFAVMVLMNTVFLWGYSRSDSGQSAGQEIATCILSKYPDAIIHNVRPRVRGFPLEMLIYLNRDVIKTEDPSTIRAAKRPQVIVYPPADSADKTFPDPVPPPGFIPLCAKSINDNVWKAFVLPGEK